MPLTTQFSTWLSKHKKRPQSVEVFPGIYSNTETFERMMFLKIIPKLEKELSQYDWSPLRTIGEVPDPDHVPPGHNGREIFTDYYDYLELFAREAYSHPEFDSIARVKGYSLVPWPNASNSRLSKVNEMWTVIDRILRYGNISVTVMPSFRKQNEKRQNGKPKLRMGRTIYGKDEPITKDTEREYLPAGTVCHTPRHRWIYPHDASNVLYAVLINPFEKGANKMFDKTWNPYHLSTHVINNYKYIVGADNSEHDKSISYKVRHIMNSVSKEFLPPKFDPDIFLTPHMIVNHMGAMKYALTGESAEEDWQDLWRIPPLKYDWGELSGVRVTGYHNHICGSLESAISLSEMGLLKLEKTRRFANQVMTGEAFTHYWAGNTGDNFYLGTNDLALAEDYSKLMDGELAGFKVGSDFPADLFGYIWKGYQIPIPKLVRFAEKFLRPEFTWSAKTFPAYGKMMSIAHYSPEVNINTVLRIITDAVKEDYHRDLIPELETLARQEERKIAKQGYNDYDMQYLLKPHAIYTGELDIDNLSKTMMDEEFVHFTPSQTLEIANKLGGFKGDV